MAYNFLSPWCLDPTIAYLNHGSFGACPAAILTAQESLRLEMEREPGDFLATSLASRLNVAREFLATFLSADPADLVFVPNATTGVNAVLRSLTFEPGEELLTTTHTYAACRNALDFVATRSGVRVVAANVPFPVRSDDEVVAAVLTGVSPRTRLALLDHVTSSTALVLPIARLVKELQARGIDALVDGAHAPGMVSLALSDLGAAYYTGNAHKWLCAPKGAAFLHVRHDRQIGLHPTVISHGYARGLHAEFDWTGTCDPTPWLCIPDAIRYLGSLVPGGWPEVMARNRALALEARALLLNTFDIAPPCPDGMIGSMASIPLPAAAQDSAAARLDTDGLCGWFRERGIRTWLSPSPVPILRISAQLYNHIEQYKELTRLLSKALHGN